MRNYWFTLVLVLLILSINVQGLSKSTNVRVDYDGKLLSVHAGGVALGQLLLMVEKRTGVQFSYDRLSAEKIVYADFENNSLVDGIKRILSQLNHAMLYDESGHVRTVLVLDRQLALREGPDKQRELYMSQPNNDISETVLSKEKAEPLSGQGPGQGENSPPPPPPGPEDNVLLQGPPGAENRLPPPLRGQSAESGFPSETAAQAFPPYPDQNRVPETSQSGSPDH